jgi:hypothetical protein
MSLAEKTDALNEALDDAETIFEMRFKVDGVTGSVPLLLGKRLAWKKQDGDWVFAVLDERRPEAVSLLKAPRHLRIAAAAVLPALWQELEGSIGVSEREVEKAIAAVRTFTAEKLSAMAPPLVRGPR